jgi:NAD(P)-dependent dehydrogenase (short-subunit alcohol dehydrogenase family)
MREFAGKVAVVTGAASGIGKGLAERFAKEGMKVVLGDIEAEALAMAEAELQKQGVETLAVRTDVSKREQVDALRDRALARFGKVHVLCNNAGVSGGGGGFLGSTQQDWEWVLGVNLMGVVNGCLSFVPTMVQQDEEGYVVNTASVLGLSTGNGSAYSVSKHAVVRLTEGLYFDLQQANAKVHCSVLCPGMIATNIILAERNRPRELTSEADLRARREREEMRRQTHQRFQEMGMAPSQVADIVLDAMKEERFYILTHPEGIKQQVKARMEGILAEKVPVTLRQIGLG